MTSAVPVEPGITRQRSGPTLTASVVICAYTEKRWENLLEAVRSVRTQLRAGDELLVVIDHNPALLARAADFVTSKDVRVLANAGERGLSGARNTGVATSRGRMVAFLDDDATARRGWLEELREAFLDETVAVVGTAVHPRWAGGRAPRWFPAEFNWVVGCGYVGLPSTASAIRNPIGASMAIRATAFVAAGAFSNSVGRVGTLPVGCEETEFCIRLARYVPDVVVLYQPRSAVDHLVPTDRQRPAYFFRRCFHEGRSKWSVARLGGAKAGLSAERRYTRVVLPAGVLRRLGRAVTRLDPVALAQASMIVLGLGCTVLGFATAAVQDLAGGKSRPR